LTLAIVTEIGGSPRDIKINTFLLFDIITSRIQHVYGTRFFLANPDVQVFDKLKKEELLTLGLHLGLEVKTSMKKQEIKIVVAEKLLSENIFTTYELQKLEQSGMSELEFKLAMEKIKFESQERDRQEREKEREREEREKERVCEEREKEREEREKERERELQEKEKERERELQEREKERELEREKN
jgi:hypothetical protein